MVNDRRSLVRRVAVASLLVLPWMAPSVQAAPITLNWNFNVNSAGPFANWNVSGFVTYDYDPLRDVPIMTYNPDGTIASIQDPVVPVTSLGLHFGGYTFDLSNAAAPAVFYPLWSSNLFGLDYSVQPGSFPPHVTQLSISPGGALFFLLGSPDVPGGMYIDQQPFSIPEPSSLILVSGALVGALFVRRRRDATRVR